MQRLLELLRATSKWMKSHEIESLIGCTSTELRQMVNELRKMGEPIVSGTDGYKYAQTEEEIRLCLANLYSRASSIREAAMGLEKARAKLDGTPQEVQGNLFDFIPRRSYG
jgi:biotin operon repressor